MKRIIQLITLLICATLWQASVQAATKYWDSNGSTPGAGNTPNGIWDSDSYWSSDSAGASATTVWIDGDAAVFSAGTDATNTFTVTVSGTPNPSEITFEEGLPLISGGQIIMTNISDFPIIANTDAQIDSALNGVGFKKTGSGRLTLGTDNSFTLQGNNTVAEGIVAITNGSALGYFLNPTIVSNGASVEVSAPVSFGNLLTLNGFGVNNRGALYGYVGTTGQGISRTGGAMIDSNARINHYGTGGSWWNWNTQVITTNGSNSADLYLGGTGNTLRLNMNIDYPSYPGWRRPCIDIGDGVLYKDGSMELRLENSNVARELRFNEGHILGRCGPGTNLFYRAVTPGVFWCTEGAFWSAGSEYVPATIYVGPNAGQFRNGTGGPSQIWQHPIVLAAGANPVFRPQSFTDASITCEGVISGLGGLSKYDDTGTLFLKATNTYSGDTTVRGGFLTLGPNGSISNSAAIDVWTNGTFNVTSNGSGFVLQPAQTLKGNGTVLGNVTALGTVSPGASVGALTITGSLTIAGNVSVDVDKSLSPAGSNDLINVSGSLSHSGGGSLTVVNLGPALAVGNSFKVFNKAVSSGGTISVTGAGATWANNLATDGSIAVTAVAPPAIPATNVTIQAAGLTSFNLGGLGAASSLYDVYAATNIAIPASNWWKIGSTNSTAGGVIQFLDTQATNKQRFYRFGQTVP